MDFDDLKASEPFFAIILGILNGILAVKKIFQAHRIHFLNLLPALLHKRL